MAGLLTALCVVHEIVDDPGGNPGRTAIDKRPVRGPVRLGHLGLEGDTQCNRKHHGGPFQAVYAYADEDAAWWGDELGRPIAPGLFGENLRTSGLDLRAAVIGERWRIGDGADAAVVRVTKPRTPCETFRRRMGEERWVKRFSQAGRVGAYLSVEQVGALAVGDRVTVLDRPAHGVTVLQAFRHDDPAAMRRLLDAGDTGGLELDADLRRRASLAVSRA